MVDGPLKNFQSPVGQKNAILVPASATTINIVSQSRIKVSYFWPKRNQWLIPQAGVNRVSRFLHFNPISLALGIVMHENR